MGLLETGAFIALLTLLILVVILTLRKPGGTLSEDRLNLLLKDRLVDFQNQIHQELDTTRREIGSSKDLISKHTIKTLETMKEMGDTIRKITQQQEEAQKFSESLKDLLQAPKLRGNYGEAILEEMLERVLPKHIWDTQVMVSDQKQVDAVIRMKGVVIPIDAKFPRDNYQRYLSAENQTEKAACWKAYETDIKRQIRDIGEKYIKPEAGTSDFALMFIPSEAVYYETIAETNYLGEPSILYEYAQKHRVIPVSPNTFYAFLQVIVIGIRNQEIIQSANQLKEGLAAMQRSFDHFFQHFETIGSHLDKATRSFQVGENHIRRYKDRLDTTLRIEAFKASPTGELDGSISSDTELSDSPRESDKTHR